MLNHYYITGSSSGIGKALCEHLLQNDSNRIVGVSRRQTIEHDHYCHISADLSNQEGIDKIQFGDLEHVSRVVLVNNAGLLGAVAHLGAADEDGLNAAVQVNLLAPMLLTNRFMKAYRKLDTDKQIINITSGAALNPYDGWAAYCCTKAALDMLTKVTDLEENMQNEFPKFRTLSIAPGVVRTNMQTEMRELNAKDFSRVQKFIDLHENDELYKAEDVAERLVDVIEGRRDPGGLISRIDLSE